jgi:hypothetical protein
MASRHQAELEAQQAALASQHQAQLQDALNAQEVSVEAILGGSLQRSAPHAS